MRALRAIAIAAALVAAAACVEQKKGSYDPTKLNSFKVEVLSGALGTATTPLAFTSSTLSYSLKVTALDGLGNTVTSFAGPVTVSAQPGIVFGGNGVTFTAGVGTGTVTLKGAYGTTRIWVEDPSTFATGLTDAIYIRNPKIYDVQLSTNTVNSPFNGQRVSLDTASQIVVTALGRDGMYLLDKTAAGGKWGSVFAFTFGSPQGVQPGDVITNVNGTIGEFLGFTELNNPSWDTTGQSTALPPYIPITCTELNQAAPNLTMEQYEAGLIEVDGATVDVCGAFPNCPDYDTYRQWTLKLPGNCSINVVSNYTLVNFDPPTNHGSVVTKMRGTLRHIQFASPEWILEPHGPTDACCPTCAQALNQGC